MAKQGIRSLIAGNMGKPPEQPPPSAAVPRAGQLEAEQFMANVYAQADRLMQATGALQEAQDRIHNLNGRIQLLEEELHRVTTARDQYLVGFSELWAQLKIIVTHVKQQHHAFETTVDSGLKGVSDRMREAGMKNPLEEETSVMTEERMHKLEDMIVDSRKPGVG